MEKTTTAPPTAELSAFVFLTAVAGLREAKANFDSGELKSVPYSSTRQLYRFTALKALAAGHGVTLQEPLQIDANGEYSLVALKEGLDPRMGCGQFGEFAAILNPHSPRTGIVPCTLSPENGWCRINHFSVENMVMAQAEARGI